MINAILGKLEHVNAHSAIILTGGIEYDLIISSQTASKLTSLNEEEKSSVRLVTYLQHKEDVMQLYGFFSEEERTLFLELNKVNGIGPKQAMKILSGVSVENFVSALDKGDVRYLSKIPGLGAKTSQKIILDLRDKLVLVSKEKASTASEEGQDSYSDIAQALVDMGYDKKKVSECLRTLVKDNAKLLSVKTYGEQEEWLFRSAVLKLS